METRVVWLIVLLGGLSQAQEREPGKGVNFYSIEKEIALGNQLAMEFRQRTRAVESPAVLAYVNGIGQRLVKEMAGPAFPYAFSVIADDLTVIHEPAAFPGGAVFVPASLILAAKDEDELAGMLAHSIAHVAGRDATKQATKAEIVSVASEPLIFMGGWTGYGLRQGAELAIPLGMQRAWRAFELNADRVAARTMAAAGWDPEGLARYIERVQAADDAGAQKKWSALPDKAERLAALRMVIDGLPARTYPGHDGFQQMQEEVRRATLPK
jgi:predicted Zn-dependent protease